MALKKDEGIGWALQLIISIGCLLLVTVGRPILASQSAVTIPLLWVVGIGGIATALYSRFKTPPPKKAAPKRNEW